MVADIDVWRTGRLLIRQPMLLTSTPCGASLFPRRSGPNNNAEGERGKLLGVTVLVRQGYQSRKFDALLATGEVMTHATELAGAQVLAKPVAPEALLAAIAASCQRQSEMA